MFIVIGDSAFSQEVGGQNEDNDCTQRFAERSRRREHLILDMSAIY